MLLATAFAIWRYLELTSGLATYQLRVRDALRRPSGQVLALALARIGGTGIGPASWNFPSMLWIRTETGSGPFFATAATLLIVSALVDALVFGTVRPPLSRAQPSGFLTTSMRFTVHLQLWIAHNIYPLRGRRSPSRIRVFHPDARFGGRRDDAGPRWSGRLVAHRPGTLTPSHIVHTMNREAPLGIVVASAE